jgi:hypothetical protein
MEVIMSYLKKIIGLVFVGTVLFNYALPWHIFFKQLSDGTLVNLDDTDRANFQKLEKILLKYQWPTCLAYLPELSIQEKKHLFAPIKGAEEILIQKNINALFEKKGPDYITDIKPQGATYKAMFVPNLFFESLDLFRKKSQEKLPKKNIELTQKSQWDNKLYDKIIQKFMDTNEEKSFLKNCQDLNFNLLRLMDFFSVNHYIIDHILTRQLMPNSLDNIIKLFSSAQWCSMQQYHSPDLYLNTLEIEYQANQSNDALLYRATEGCTRTIGIQDIEEGVATILDSTLVASTLVKCQTQNNMVAFQPLKNWQELTSAYKTKELAPRSISYSHSLLTALESDASACTYWLAASKIFYILRIDKKQFVENACNNIFDLPSVMPSINNVSGEFFHPRTAIPTKNPVTLLNLRVHGSIFKFSQFPNTLRVDRDPLIHEAIVADFLADNSQLVEYRDQKLEFGMKARVEQQFNDELRKTAQHCRKYVYFQQWRQVAATTKSNRLKRPCTR